MRKFIYVLIAITLYANQAITPLKPIPYNHKKALLGKALFFETALSKDRSVACVSCHDIFGSGGADQRIVSIGYEGKEGNIQSPTVLNAVYNFRQFWNGRAKDLYEQATGPLNNPVEHNMTPKLVVQRVSLDPIYKRKFQEIYQDGVTYKNIIDAIVEFEKALVTLDSKFDRYLKKEVQLSKEELQGYELFKQYGCISCHNGINLGGNAFAKIGIFHPYPNQKNYPDRFVMTKNPMDKNVFKIPTLRNIAKTAPYFHDGSQKTLHEAIRAMGVYNLGIKIPNKDIDTIETFLKTLNGELPGIVYEE